jgi:hypothetical protein
MQLLQQLSPAMLPSNLQPDVTWVVCVLPFLEEMRKKIESNNRALLASLGRDAAPDRQEQPSGRGRGRGHNSQLKLECLCTQPHVYVILILINS